MLNSHRQSRKGLLFVATGVTYLEEAASNALAARVHCSHIPIAISTDLPEEARKFGVFDLILAHCEPRWTYRDKIPALLKLPFKYTLYLDSDARVISSVDSLFDSLGNSDIAAVHAPVRRPDGWFDHSVPILFPELNTGVLLLRRSRQQQAFIRSWLRLYDEVLNSHHLQWDQATFRSVIWNFQQRRGFRFASLPAEANLRTTKPWIAGKGLLVYVVHGRVPENEWLDFEHYLNDNINCFRHWSEWQSLFPESSIQLKIPPDPISF